MNPIAPGRRRMAVRTGALLVAAVAATATALAHSASAGPVTTAVAGSSVYSVAPYVDMSNSQESLLDTAITGHGLKAYTAAFVIGAGCNQIWGDTLPIGNDSYTDPEIAKAKSEGASVIISSGGAAGEPLAWTCTTQSSINAGYAAIVDDYGVTQLDFDVEGAAVADGPSIARHFVAIKALQASHPSVKFSMTLPVLPDGLTIDGVNLLKAAKSAGVKIDVVNVMTMDYYQGQQDMGAAAIKAAQSTLAQMQSVDSTYTWANVGITPMVGTNDDGSTFTSANARSVESFAASNGVGRLAFWSINRDQPCGGVASSGTVTPAASSTCSGVGDAKFAFTDAFVPYTGTGGGTTGGTTTGGTTTGGTTTGGTTGGTTTGGTTGGTTTGGTTGGTGGGGCTATPWSSTTSYAPNDVVSYNGHKYTATYWSTGVQPGSAIAWNIWKDDGAC